MSYDYIYICPHATSGKRSFRWFAKRNIPRVCTSGRTLEVQHLPTNSWSATMLEDTRAPQLLAGWAKMKVGGKKGYGASVPYDTLTPLRTHKSCPHTTPGKRSTRWFAERNISRVCMSGHTLQVQRLTSNSRSANSPVTGPRQRQSSHNTSQRSRSLQHPRRRLRRSLKECQSGGGILQDIMP